MEILFFIILGLDVVAILLVAIEDVYLDGLDRFKYYLFVLFVPIIGALYTMYKLGGGKSPYRGGTNGDYNSSSHWDSGSDGGGGD